MVLVNSTFIQTEKVLISILLNDLSEIDDVGVY